MPLPRFREDGWLPEGHHQATWEEVVATFGGEPDSQPSHVLSLLFRWRDAVRAKGMSGRLILKGSFISQKFAPGDFDAIFVYDAATEERLKGDPEARALISYSRCRSDWQADIFTFAEATAQRFPQMCALDMFDYEKTTGTPKGVVEVRI
jgi:hypothetical protein